jgi:hypothetical protein
LTLLSAHAPSLLPSFVMCRLSNTCSSYRKTTLPVHYGLQLSLPLSAKKPTLDTMLGTTVFPLNRGRARVARETCFSPLCTTPWSYKSTEPLHSSSPNPLFPTLP